MEKSMIRDMEATFDKLLDQYCLSLEQGDSVMAEAVSENAERLLEEIGVQKVKKLLETTVVQPTTKHHQVLNSVLAHAV